MSVRSKILFGRVGPLVFLLLIFLLNSCRSDPSPGPGPGPSPNPSLAQSLNYSLWNIGTLSDSLEILKTNQVKFMDESSMLGTYLELELGESADLDNNQDNLCYVHSGQGSLTIDGDEIAVEEGKVILIKANSNARLSSILSPLRVVIVSMKKESSFTSPASRVFSKSEIEASRSSKSNVWNPFLNFSNLILGLYMLPKPLNGDSRLVHTWEELNIITSGSSKFKMDGDEVTVDRGSIVFVKNGNGHFFRSLTSDIDILIFWEQP